MAKALHQSDHPRMDRSFFLCVVFLWVVLACPLASLAGQQIQAHRVAPGDSIRSLLLRHGCVRSMEAYATARQELSRLNPGLTHSGMLVPGSTIRIPSRGKKGGRCLTYAEQHVIRVEFEATPRAERVRIYLDGPVLPDAFTLKTTLPVRVVCDFDGVLPLSELPRAMDCQGRLIHKIRVGHEDKPFPRARVVLDIDQSVAGRIEQEFFEQESMFQITVHEASVD